MHYPVVLIILLSFFLQGCYQTTLAPMIGPAASASQGRLAYSAASTSVSYGVKHKTGKFPIEHILKREKDKVVKRIDTIEKEVIEKSTIIKNKFINKKNNLKIKEKTSKKLRWVLHIKEIKNVEQKEAFPANKPRYSYQSQEK